VSDGTRGTSHAAAARRISGKEGLEEDGSPVLHRPARKKVKSDGAEKVKFPTPPGEEKVKSGNCSTRSMGYIYVNLKVFS
jgi:hypothetical protein